MIFGRRRVLTNEAALVLGLINEELGSYVNVPSKYLKEAEEVYKKYSGGKTSLLEALIDKGILMLDGGGYLTINGKKLEEVVEDYPEIKKYLDLTQKTLIRKYIILIMKKYITLIRALKALDALTPAVVKRLIDLDTPLPVSVMLADYSGSPIWKWLDEEYRKKYLRLISRESLLLSERFLAMLEESESDRKIINEVIKEDLRAGEYFVATALAYHVLPELLGPGVREHPLVKVRGNYCVKVGEWCVVLESYPVNDRYFFVFPLSGGYGLLTKAENVVEAVKNVKDNYGRTTYIFEELVRNKHIAKYVVKDRYPFKIVKIFYKGRWYPLSEAIIRKLQP